MEFFYCVDLSDVSEVVQLSGEESHHLRRVFRKRSGDLIALSNGKGLLAEAVIEKDSAQKISCRIRNLRKILPPPERRIHLALSLIRPNRMDWAVEKLAELGAGSIQPLLCRFSSIKTFKAEHLRKIAVSAMKQSEQAYLPELLSPLSFEKFLRQLPPPESRLRLIAHRAEEAVSFKEIAVKPGQEILIAVGPEGGFSEEEVTQARESGFRPLKLAGQILRAETAAVVAVAQAKLHLL